jgi:hypothetical protein
VYDFLLFVHVLAAFCLMAVVVMYTAWTLGAAAPPRLVVVAEILWGIGGAGTLIFGVWLVFNVEGYDILDGWIIAALVLWALSAEAHRRAYTAIRPTAGIDGVVVAADDVAMARWSAIRALLVLLLLIVMIFKPGV